MKCNSSEVIKKNMLLWKIHVSLTNLASVFAIKIAMLVATIKIPQICIVMERADDN